MRGDLRIWSEVAFDDRVRIDMAKMLESVPAEIQEGLPTKKARQTRRERWGPKG